MPAKSRYVRALVRVGALLLGFGFATFLALRLQGGGLWEGLTPAIAANNAAFGLQNKASYDLTSLKVVNEVLRNVRDRYVDPKRVKPREMLLSALNYVQRDVAQVIVLHDEGAPTAKVRVDTQEREFRIDNVQGPWDVSARLREVFAFVQDGLRGTEVDLREVEYAACNGMLHTLDPHSVLLSPEAYKEMSLSTSGQFGGLGIVISIRDQQLTVINPIPGTPAVRAGIRKYDRITKINTESTLNMGLNEAVNHLRGAPGSKVTVHVHRDGADGWQGSRPFELTRETIRVASIESKLLEGNIGYIRLKQFQANSSAELDEALRNLKKSGELKGLVLDLRGNPGGLLDQAARVADKFLTEGPIVATVGNPSEGREEKSAHVDGTEPNYPIALLVNGSSASASEIVAGAMKNHDRAVLIGDTTFGKGSVQLVFAELPDKAALKLTIAQYLTEPGDVSIQGTGVTPDIQLDPMTVDSQEMDLTVDTGGIKERDLSRSLSNARAREGQRPSEVVRYDLPQKDRQELRERGGDPDDNFAMDFQIRFAREFVAKVAPGKRLDQLRAAKNVINEVRGTELNKVAAELKTIGVDWADAPADVAQVQQPAPPAAVDVKVETERPNNEVQAGDPMTVKVTLTNKGTTPLFRLYAVTKSDNPYFDNKELVIGRLDPGKSKTATAPLGWCDVEGHRPGSTAVLPKDAPRVCRIPRDALTRADGIKLHFEEARGRAPADAELRATIRALERPVFAYAYQVADNRKGNGDGRIQKDEGVTVYLTVRNVGKGRSYETQANLRNLSGDGLLLHDGRFDLSSMNPGETRKVAFTFDVQSQLPDAEAKVELSIADRDLRESVAEKIRMPIAAPIALQAGSGAMRAKGSGAELFESPEGGARLVGKLPGGASAGVMATANDYTKLALGGGRFAFARTRDLEPGGAAGGAVAFEETMAHAPPAIELAATSLFTRDAHTAIKATALDSERLLDAFIFVGSRKVFYRSNRGGADPKKMPFEADLPLRPGVNIVSIVARESPDTTTRKTFIVRRDGPNGELLSTPKTDDDLAENAAGADND
ncbi:S41 family peptidase [Pendulispora brunnea]|uniref:S41 family peptidase n=1 Tax=Pendulispora brunnea TaxID=2905690 RepID=A0ABZ2JZI4_9BACT